MLKRILTSLLSLTLLLTFILGCENEELSSPEVLGAHVAENTTPLETDKFLDYPDFILYTKGDETVRLSPELQAAVYAEYERLIYDYNGVDFDWYDRGVDLAYHVNSMKEVGAIRFCYSQRRKFTGEIYLNDSFSIDPYREAFKEAVKDENGKANFYLEMCFWEDLQYDEVIFRRCEFFFGVDGKYFAINEYQCATFEHNVWTYMKYGTYGKTGENRHKAGGESATLLFYDKNSHAIFFKSMVDIAEAGLVG